LIKVVLSQTPGQQAQPNAVLVTEITLSKGKPVVFITRDGVVKSVISMPAPDKAPSASEGAAVQGSANPEGETPPTATPGA
jgi:hypothetical protein